MVLSSFFSSAVGLLCAAVLYGLYLAIFTFSVWLVISRQKTHPVNKLVTYSTWLLFPLCTAHIVLQFASFCNVLDTQVLALDTGAATLFPYLESAFGFSSVPLRATVLLTSVVDFVGDLILIYRCWIMWGRNWTIILFPSIAIVASIVCIFTAGLIGRVSSPATILALPLTAFTLPLLIHVLITSLIVGRIYWTSRAAWHSGTYVSTPSYIQYIMAVVIESGLLYVVVQITLLVLLLINSPGVYVVLVPALPVYAIAPTLILLRISLSASTECNHPISTAIIFSEQLQELDQIHFIPSEEGRQSGADVETVLDITLMPPAGQ